MELEKINDGEEWGLHSSGLYVSTEGRVYNPKTELYSYGGWKNKRGYISIKYNNKIYSMHRLVAETFLPNPYNHKQVNHINERKDDNRKENLEFCTQAYNIRYGTRTKRTCKPVLQYDKEGNFIAMFPSVTQAANSNDKYYEGDIARCCRGEKHTAYGYIWKYVYTN